MSLFNSILEKLGLGKDKPVAAAGTTAVPKPVADKIDKGERDNAPVKSASSPVKPAAPAKPAAPPVMDGSDEEPEVRGRDRAALKASAPKAISEVDVVKNLEQMAKGSGLDWKVSIVDMLKVLGIDSSKDARIELAKELGCPADLIGGDYSKMNVWLHKEVLKRIAENGGNIPANMLD